MFDLSNVTVDWAVSKAIQFDRNINMDIYVVNHDDYFGHEETEGGTRRKENS